LLVTLVLFEKLSYSEVVCLREVCIDLIPKRSDEVCSTLPLREEEPLNSSYAAAERLESGLVRYERDQKETAQIARGSSAEGYVDVDVAVGGCC
jgi:hypothetical protein